MSDENNETKKKGLLSRAFNSKAVKFVAFGVVGALLGNVAWQIFLDPLFFPIIHDTTNITTQAWCNMIQSTFNFIPESLGFIGDWGLLKTDFMQSVLAPYAEKVATIAPDQINNLFNTTTQTVTENATDIAETMTGSMDDLEALMNE